MAKLAQINLQGSALATAELPAVARDAGVDIVLAQKPYCGEPHSTSMLFPADPAPKVGIYIARRDIACGVLHHLSTSHCLVCHMKSGSLSVHLDSAYFQYSEDIWPHLEHLTRVLQTLRGNQVVVGADTNTHSPLWHSQPRHYSGRGSEITRRREAVEGFIMAHGLITHNASNQPPTFATVNGESNIDVTMSTRGVRVENWRVHEGASSSDHHLITFELGDPTCRRSTTPPNRGLLSPGEPRRFRERDVDWEQFQWAVHSRIGKLRWKRLTATVCEEFTRTIAQTACECLGMVGERNEKGYEWWNPALESMRRKYNRARKHWQKAKKRPLGIYQTPHRD
uniref:Endonuclease/exonuclease/phosphatase domain-containing protein n=1 Tax=Heliothis virescens TaxID=7102 RepID=A0A2A4JA05_HELVI